MLFRALEVDCRYLESAFSRRNSLPSAWTIGSSHLILRVDSCFSTPLSWEGKPWNKLTWKGSHDIVQFAFSARLSLPFPLEEGAGRGSDRLVLPSEPRPAPSSNGN